VRDGGISLGDSRGNLWPLELYFCLEMLLLIIGGSFGLELMLLIIGGIWVDFHVRKHTLVGTPVVLPTLV
jgi:hypothetical protein